MHRKANYQINRNVGSLQLLVSATVTNLQGYDAEGNCVGEPQVKLAPEKLKWQLDDACKV